MFFLTLLAFIIILGLLVFVHEAGHFIAAKLSGVKVEEFAFGFPPRLYTKKVGETNYSINAIPFGGYVKMLGEEKKSDSARSYSHKRPRIRFGIVVAGVVMNFILAGLLFSVGYMIGMPPIRINPEKIGGQQIHQVVIAQVNEGSSAKQADLKVGDLVLGYGSVEDFSAFTRQNLGESIDISVKRDGETISKVVQVSDNEQAPLGVGIVDVPIIKLGFFKAIYAGFVEMGLTTAYITVMLGQLIGDLFSGRSVGGAVAGPIGIFNVTGQAVKMGFTYIVQLTALLSINLGLINILPIPALDGGRAVLIAAEAIARKKVIREEVENVMHLIGFIVLIVLILLISAKEIIGLF